MRGAGHRRAVLLQRRAGLAGGDAGSGGVLRLWTAKEAVLKAMGTGLSTPLNALSVRPGEDAPPWNLRELDLAPGYAAAVAFDGPPAEPQILSA